MNFPRSRSAENLERRVMDVAATTLDVVSEKIEKLHVTWSARLSFRPNQNRPQISLSFSHFFLFLATAAQIVFLLD